MDIRHGAPATTVRPWPFAFVAGSRELTSAWPCIRGGGTRKESKLEVAAFKRCAVAKSMTTVRKSAATVDALTPSGTTAARNLRRDLGLATH